MDIWPQALAALRGQMTTATFNQLVEPLHANQNGHKLILTAPNNQAAELVQRRLLKLIAPTVEALAPDCQVVIASADDPPPEATIELFGEYTTPYTSRVKPDVIEVSTQYFRRYWRPLLKPVLSELVRELRQRCYYGRGEDRQRRNTAECTRQELAAALGVSTRTIDRCLERDYHGNFTASNYLNLFITDMTILTRYDEDHKRVVNDRTRFTIALDEPISPIDPISRKRQNDV